MQARRLYRIARDEQPNVSLTGGCLEAAREDVATKESLQTGILEGSYVVWRTKSDASKPLVMVLMVGGVGERLSQVVRILVCVFASADRRNAPEPLGENVCRCAVWRTERERLVIPLKK